MEFNLILVITVFLSIITSIVTGFFLLKRYKQKIDKFSKLNDQIHNNNIKLEGLDEFKNYANKILD